MAWWNAKNPSKTIICMECGKRAPRRSPYHMYCAVCRPEVNYRLWRAATRRRRKKDPGMDRRNAEWRRNAYDAAKGYGRQKNLTTTTSPMKFFRRPGPNLIAYHCVSFPFLPVLSKNRMYGRAANNHNRIYMRDNHRLARDGLEVAISSSLNGTRPPTGKIWIDLFVQKPSMNTDAVNFVDAVCDALAKVTGVDDRWYSIRSLDWEIVHENPCLYVGFGWEHETEQCSCLACGRLFEPAKGAGRKVGSRRSCLDCWEAGKKLLRSASANR
ncbi:MAG TPA: hypothetical protein VJ547_11995 [Candidatus Thermoplasmatota archaeon]|nr:hypothetical protein [Candidatus Thermoplasmatota archaeon]